MLNSHRFSTITAGLALAAAFSVGGYILGFGLGEQSGQYEANTDTYARHAQAEIDSACARLDGAAYTECIIRVVEATNEHERSESDLNAQRNMARWALLMLLATVAMAVITAFGVYYVWRTLLATQKMASETTKVGEAQVRAYVTIQSCTVVFDPEKSNIGFRVQVKNSGNSPVTNVKVEFRFDLRKIDSHGTRGMETITAQTIPAQSEERIGKMFHEKADVEELSKYYNIGEIFIVMNPILTGSDVFGKPVYADRVFGLDAKISADIDGAKMISLDTLAREKLGY